MLAEGPHRAARALHVGEAPRMEASNDMEFRPDRALADGEVVSGGDWTIEAVTTPGHTANHMAFALKESELVFSGDHVMGLVDTGRGAARWRDERLHEARWTSCGRRPEPIYLPGHGGAVRDAPRFVAALHPPPQGARGLDPASAAKGAADIPTMCASIYIGLDQRLVKAAGLSVLAHLEDLVARGVVATDGPPSIDGVYRLAWVLAFS